MKLTKPKLNKKTIFLTAFFLAFLGYLPFLIRDHGFFTYFGDYNLQQIPFYLKLHEAIRNGTLFWDMKTDLGSSIYTSYSFYLLGSPFFYLTLPFPKEAIPYLMPYLSMLKIALACLGGSLYTARFVQDKRSCFIGGLLYAFCGFQLVSLVFNHFGEVIAFFPFYLLTLETLVEKKKRGLFAIMTACMAILNYFFFINEIVFIILYVLVRYVLNKTWTKKERLFCLLRIAAEGLIGVLLSGFFVLPSVIAVLNNKRATQSIFDKNIFFYEDMKTYGALIKNMFLPPDSINRATLFGTEEGAIASVSLFLPLFALSGVLAFYFYKKAPDFRKKLSAVCFLFALLPIGNALFVAGNGTYYTRWFFMPLLILATMTASAIEEFDQKAFTKGTIIQAVFVCLFFMIGMISKDVTGALKHFLMVSNRSHYNLELWVAFISLLILVYLVWILDKDKKRNYLNTMLFCTIVCCIGVLYLHISMGCSIVDDTGRASFQAQIQKMPSLPDETGESFYRIETDDSSINYGMCQNIASVNCFLSTISGSIMDFYDFAGINRTVKSQIPYDRIGLRSLLSVRYFLQNELKSEDYAFLSNTAINSYLERKTEAGFRIYENQNYLKPGAIFTHYMKRSEYEKLSATQKDFVLLYALVIDDDKTDAFKNYEMLTELSAKDFIALHVMDLNAFSAQCKLLNETASNTFAYTDTSITLHYSNAKAGMAFLSVPYSDGFTAFLDQKETVIHKTDGGLMAVYLPAGEHTVEYIYKEPGLFVGILCSLFGLILLILRMGALNSYDSCFFLKSSDS